MEGRDDDAKTMRHMRAYFDLCSEEFYLHKRKLIDENVWELWGGGMRAAFSKAAFRQAWARIKKDTLYDEKFKAFVEQQMSRTVNVP